MGRDFTPHMKMTNGERLCISGDDEMGSYIRPGRVGSIGTNTDLRWEVKGISQLQVKVTWILLQKIKRALNSSGAPSG